MFAPDCQRSAVMTATDTPATPDGVTARAPEDSLASHTAGDAGSGTGRSTGATRAGSARIIRRQFWWALDAAIAHAYDRRRSCLHQGPLRNHRKSGCRSGQCSPPIDKGPLLQSAGFSSIEGQCPPTTDEGPLRNHRKPGRRSGKC